MIETGQILQQRYKIDRQIGQGGMGAVYVATDERFGSTVAIKETLCMDDNYRKAIEREARLLNSLKHHALPRVTDHFLESNGQFLVMEYIPGEDLCCVLDERDEPFSVEQVLNWADQLLEALEFLHSQENPVIHRDIKPQNLKITPKGQIILLDFGLAKGNVTGAGNLTNSKSIFGYSRNYASLEQIQGTGTDPRSDLYSLAATLYHLLTKIPPEDALTRAMSVLSQKPDPLIPANQTRPEIPSGVAAILHKALDLDAAERPSSALEMRGMLHSHVDHSGLAFSTVLVARADSTDIHSQPTQLMPGVTVNEGLRPTQAKTEVISGQMSQVTAIRPLVNRHGTDGIGSVSEHRGSRKMFAAAGLVGVLLLVGSIVGGILSYDPSILGIDTSEPVITDLPVEPKQEAAVVETNSNTAAAESGAAAMSVTPDEPKPEAGQTAKRSETVKTAKTNPKTDPDEIDIDGPVVVDGENMRIGNMQIRKGKVIMPDGTVYDESTGVRVSPPDHPVPPNVTEPDLRRLTPEQRRKLRLLRQRYPGSYPVPTPHANN